MRVCLSALIVLAALSSAPAVAEGLDEVFRAYVEASQQLEGARGDEWAAEWAERFARALDTDDGSASPQVRLRVLEEMGMLQRSAGRPADARATFERMESEARALEDPGYVFDSLFHRIMTLNMSDEYGEFADLSEHLWDWHEWYLSQPELDQGEMGRAMERYRGHLESIGLRHVIAARHAGQEAEQAARFANARNALDLAYGMDPAAQEPYTRESIGTLLAEAELALGNRTRAGAIYRELLAQEELSAPRSRIAHLELKTRASRGSEAYINGLREIVRLYPDEQLSALRQQLAAALAEAGRHAEAIEVLQDMLEAGAEGESKAGVLSFMASEYLELGRFEEAEAALEQLIAEAPRSRRVEFARETLEYLRRRLDGRPIPAEAAGEDLVTAGDATPAPIADARAAADAERTGGEMPTGDSLVPWSVIGLVAGAVVLMAAFLMVRAVRRARG